MHIDITFGGGVKINAHVDGYTIHTDQPATRGGEGTAPDPMTFFLSSLGTCAGFYIAKFCQSRDLSTDGFKISVDNDFNSQIKAVDNITINLEIPDSFPKKYHTALLRTVDQCTVKKTIANQPSINVITKS